MTWTPSNNKLTCEPEPGHKLEIEHVNDTWLWSVTVGKGWLTGKATTKVAAKRRAGSAYRRILKEQLLK